MLEPQSKTNELPQTQNIESSQVTAKPMEIDLTDQEKIWSEVAECDVNYEVVRTCINNCPPELIACYLME